MDMEAQVAQAVDQMLVSGKAFELEWDDSIESECAGSRKARAMRGTEGHLILRWIAAHVCRLVPSTRHLALSPAVCMRHELRVDSEAVLPSSLAGDLQSTGMASPVQGRRNSRASDSVIAMGRYDQDGTRCGGEGKSCAGAVMCAAVLLVCRGRRESLTSTSYATGAGGGRVPMAISRQRSQTLSEISGVRGRWIVAGNGEVPPNQLMRPWARVDAVLGAKLPQEQHCLLCQHRAHDALFPPPAASLRPCVGRGWEEAAQAGIWASAMP